MGECIEEKNAFIEIMKEIGWSPLHCMTEREDLNSIKELLAQDSNVNILDDCNRTPLSVAASKGNLELVEFLVSKGADVNQGFPLHYASEKGHFHIVNYLVKNGALTNLEKENTYPLLIAASNGDLEIVKVLTEHGADVHVVDKDKETALHWACDSGNIDLISFLIDVGCNTDIQDKFGLTPLSICLIRKENRPDLVKLLLKKGASASIPDEEGYTYLHSAEHPESLLELIKHGVNVNSQNIYQETPLYNVSFYRQIEYIECAKVLLQNGANPNIPAKGGWTPLHFAAAEGYLEYVEELLQWKADVNSVNAENIIPLHLAAYNGHLEIVKLLLENGSFIDIPVIDLPYINNNVPYLIEREAITDGLTPISLAATNGHKEVCELLAQFGAKTENAENSCVTKKINDWPQNNLLSSVRSNNLEEIESVSDVGCLEVVDLIGWTLLHHAVYNGFYDMSHLLIKKGISVNALDKYQRTPLSIAAAKNDVRMFNLLMDSGSDVNLGFVLHYAIDQESLECIHELIKYSCDINVSDKTDLETPPLLQAVSALKTKIVNILLTHKANPNCTNKHKETPLHLSCRLGDLETAQILLNHGANVNAVDSIKETPLLNAARSNNNDLVKLLLSNDADVHAKNNFDWTSLHNAAYSNSEIVALDLINAGASVNAVNDEGETPLFSAVGNVAILQTLIQHAADVNYRAPGGWTALHECTEEGNLDCVKELLKHNANVNSASAEFVLPIYIAAIGGHASIVEELLQHGSIVDPAILNIGVIRDDSGNHPLSERYHIVAGNTPLIGAASKGYLDVVKVLCLHGASLNAVNHEGNSALHEAVVNGFVEIVDFLLTLEIDLDIKNVEQKSALDLAKDQKNEELVQLISTKIR